MLCPHDSVGVALGCREAGNESLNVTLRQCDILDDHIGGVLRVTSLVMGSSVTDPSSGANERQEGVTVVVGVAMTRSTQSLLSLRTSACQGDFQ